ncbi:MAG: TolC family protein [Phycisphaerales bacterium]
MQHDLNSVIARRSARRPLIAIAGGLVAVGLTGCRSPLDRDDAMRTSALTLQNIVDREINGAADSSPDRTTAYPASRVEQTLAGRRGDLDALSPASGATGSSVGGATLGEDLLGRPQSLLDLDLEAAVIRAIANNLSVDQARFQPAIDAESILDAEAVFDWVFFAGASTATTDRPAVVRTISGTPVTPPFQASRAYRFESGLDRRYDFGGQLRLTADVTRNEDMVDSTTSVPDPGYVGAVRLGFDQPLLRGFGRDVNRASIRLSRNERARSVAGLESTMLDVSRAVEAAYYELVLAWRRLEVQQWLVNVGIEVRDVLDKRRALDARDAQFADAVARVEQRQADVLRARRSVQAASDRLKLLINDADVTIGSEALLRPTIDVDVTPLTFNLREMLITAIDQRPEVESALLRVDDTRIAREVADNGVLPRLDLTAELAFNSLGDSWDDSVEDVFNDRFVETLLGLRFEMPIGNRGPEAQARRARLQGSQAMAGYQQTVQGIVSDVKAALRDVETNYDLIQATRSFRVAQAENLRALMVEKETLAGLTPEFLNLEFQRQETLSSARIQEFQAEVAYRTAIADLARASGTGLDRYGIVFEDAARPGPINVEAGDEVIPALPPATDATNVVQPGAAGLAGDKG